MTRKVHAFTLRSCGLADVANLKDANSVHYARN